MTALNAEFGFHPEKRNLTAGTTSFSHAGLAVRLGISCSRMPKLHPVQKDFKTRVYMFFKDQSQMF